MYWNYRVVDTSEGEEESFLEVCEVFYDENDDPAGWAPARLCGDNIEDLGECAKLMIKAMNSPTLTQDDFIGKYYEHEGELH